MAFSLFRACKKEKHFKTKYHQKVVITTEYFTPHTDYHLNNVSF